MLCAEVLCAEVLCAEVLCAEVLYAVVLYAEVLCAEVLYAEVLYAEGDTNCSAGKGILWCLKVCIILHKILYSELDKSQFSSPHPVSLRFILIVYFLYIDI